MTETIGTFVDLAKQLNKTIIYDIDDLVIDTQYTDQIKYVMAMPEEDKKAYDNNVMNMQKLLRKCDFCNYIDRLSGRRVEKIYSEGIY